MIIYCASPPNSDASYQKFYQGIIKSIESMGHTVLSAYSDKFSSSIPLTERQIYKRNLKWIDGSKMMVAEISGPSIGVGFEIAYAIFNRKIPVLVLSAEDIQNVSAMLYGCDSQFLTLRHYTDAEDVKAIITSFISKIDTR
jgi:hypothetical protein